MYGEKGLELIKEINLNRNVLVPYNSDLIEQVAKEISLLVQDNRKDAQETIDTSASGNNLFLPTVRIRHLAIKRNVRCLLAYHYNRVRCLRTMRWEFGSLLPPEIKTNLSTSESQWFSKYSGMLAKYMRSIGDEGGVNLCMDLKPPKSLYMDVQCLTDYGRHELSDGSVILLQKNKRYYLPRRECEEFIRLGIFEHIVS